MFIHVLGMNRDEQKIILILTYINKLCSMVSSYLMLVNRSILPHHLSALFSIICFENTNRQVDAS